MQPLRLGMTSLDLREVRVRGRALWILDEGAAAGLYGGNKVRKLAYLLAEAVGSGATDVLTFGAVGSHHVLATALHGGALGLRTHAVFIAQPDHPHVRAQAARSVAALASWDVADPVATLPAATARVTARVLAETGRLPFVVPPGGSSVTGTMGWVRAGRALGEALGPEIEVVVASGSGGTAAGLWAGGCRVRAVRVGPRTLTHRARLLRLGRGAAYAWSGPCDLPSAARLTIDGSYLGGGYGVVDARTARALRWGHDLGLPMEPTYTAKALAAAWDRAAVGPVCFVQSASSVAPPVPAHPLPPALEQLL